MNALAHAVAACADDALALPHATRVYRNHLLDSTRWQRFRARDGDIVIASSYKTGTTWMQGICAALVFPGARPPGPQDELSPWIEARYASTARTFARLDRATHRRFVKTHLPLDGVPYDPRLRYLVMGRDGLDVFMSLWRHWNNMRPDAIARINALPGRVGAPLPLPPAHVGTAFDDWLATGGFAWERDGHPFWSHLAHARSWWAWRHLPNLLFVHYDDLLADTPGEMRRVADFLGIAVDAARWPALLDSVSFATMKANAADTVPAADQDLWKDVGDFFHRGSNGRWRGVLTAEQVARYRRRAAETLEPSLAAWLEHGWRGDRR
jgi:aryl sulfotransferase